MSLNVGLCLLENIFKADHFYSGKSWLHNSQHHLSQLIKLMSFWQRVLKQVTTAGLNQFWQSLSLTLLLLLLLPACQFKLNFGYFYGLITFPLSQNELPRHLQSFLSSSYLDFPSFMTNHDRWTHIERKVVCTKEFHLFISTKHPHLPHL